MNQIDLVFGNEWPAAAEVALLIMGNAKTSGAGTMTWREIADAMNEHYDMHISTDDSCRKMYGRLKEKEAVVSADVFVRANDVYEPAVDVDLEKAKIKLRDERTDYQRTIRQQARLESFVDIVRQAMREEIKPFKMDVTTPVIQSDADMVVCLSDLHTGLEVHNAWNSYDNNVMRERLVAFANQIVEIQDCHKCRDLHIALGGDLISGIIHQSIARENTLNVVQQIRVAAECIAGFIRTIKDKFVDVYVHSVSGNHSRVTPNKDQHLKGEELDDLVAYCVGLLVGGCEHVFVDDVEKNLDETISVFNTRLGGKFVLCHGDKDSLSSVANKMTMCLGYKPDAIIMGHRHCNALSTDNGIKIVQSGCVVGPDSYAVDLRLTGRPEQAVFITTQKRPVWCVYDCGL